MKILIVEDDANLSKFMSQSLTAEGFNIDVSSNGNEGLDLALANNYKCILLDIMLPSKGGLEILKELREKEISTPVLMLTARNEVSDRVDGLNLGADDYLSKPFSFEELRARLNALIRRTDMTGKLSIQYENLELDTVRHVAKIDNNEIILTIKEYELLELLLRNANNPISRADINKLVWKQNYVSDSNVIDVYIKRLRQKLGKRNDGKQFIRSIRGVGYILGDKEGE